MSRAIDIMFNLLKPYTTIFTVVFVGIIFLAVSYYGYKHLYKKKEKKVDFSNTNPNAPKETITIYYFFADWCPHCKKTRGDWNAFASEFNGKTVGNYNIICYDEDCSDRDNPTKLQTKYNVFQYPTVKAVKPDNGEELEIMFDSRITKTNLEKFVNSICEQ